MKKTLRKALSVVIAVTLVFCTLCYMPMSFAADDSIKFALAADLHMTAENTTLEQKYPENQMYFHADGSGNLYDESTGITNSFLNDAAQQDVDFVLISGDLTRSGTEDEHRYVAELLNGFESRTGLPVYVVPGNHDLYNVTPDEFKSFYKNFGYGEALTVDGETASYTMDLPDGYRLIAVDSNDPGEDGDGVTDRLYGWISEQVTKAHSEGKEVLYTMHHSLLEHIPLGKLLMKDFIISDSDKVAEKFCEMGIQYVFSGHEHGNDVARYVGKNGKVVYDVLTTSLTSYPLEYRMVTCGRDGLSLRMRSIDNCDFTTLIDGYTDEQLSLMESDYNAYSQGYFKFAIEKKILKYTSPEFLKKKIKINDGIIADEIDALMGLVGNALNMPIYDSGDGTLSVESLAALKGVTIPESDYTSLCDLVTSLVARHYYGDENMSAEDSPECEIFVKGLNTGLEYILSNAGEESLKALFKLSDEFFNTPALDRWYSTIGTESSYDTAEAVLNPLLEKLLVDKAPADRDVDLPAFGESVSKTAKLAEIIEIIIDVIKYILNVVIAIVK